MVKKNINKILHLILRQIVKAELWKFEAVLFNNDLRK